MSLGLRMGNRGADDLLAIIILQVPWCLPKFGGMSSGKVKCGRRCIGER